METALSIVIACLVGCIGYIIQSQRTDFNLRQKQVHDKMNELQALLSTLVAEVAVLKDRSERG